MLFKEHQHYTLLPRLRHLRRPGQPCPFRQPRHADQRRLRARAPLGVAGWIRRSDLVARRIALRGLLSAARRCAAVPGAHVSMTSMPSPATSANTGDCNTSKTACSPAIPCSLPARLLDKVGTFDPRYFGYFGDIDFGLRVQRGGLKMVCAKGAWLWHEGAGRVQGQCRAHQAGLRRRFTRCA